MSHLQRIKWPLLQGLLLWLILHNGGAPGWAATGFAIIGAWMILLHQESRR